MRLCIALLSLFAFACEDAKSVTTAPALTVTPFPIPEVAGISGITRDEGGTLYAVPERDRRLARIPVVTGPIELLPIIGAPRGIDLESIAWVGGATLAFGTESNEKERLTDIIYYGLVTSTGIVLKEKFLFDYGAFQARAGRNQGVEALCSAGRRLIAVAEVVFDKGGRRTAPLISFALPSGEQSRFLLELTTSTGKISGMACRAVPHGEALEMLAIERHYAVGVINRYVLPLENKEAVLPAEQVFDFGSKMSPPPNFEAITWLSNDEILIMSDNQSGKVTGETQIVRLTLPLHGDGR
jgi:hypothetical protein